MSTKNIVPRTGSEGSIGTVAKPWKQGYFDTGSFKLISGSIGSASYAISASYAPPINTSNFIQNNQTSSFVLNSQTSSFVLNSQTGSFITTVQTASFVVSSQTASMTVLSASCAPMPSITGLVSSSQTGSFLLPTSTASFVTNSQTSSFLIGSSTASFVVNSQTSSFVLNSQTSSFTTNDATASLVMNSQTSSFVLNSQTASFMTNDATASLVQSNQTSSMTVATASFVLNAVSASYAPFTDIDNFVFNNQTSSMMVLSSSYALSASYAPSSNGLTALNQTDGNITSSGTLLINGVGQSKILDSLLLGPSTDADATLYISGSQNKNLIEIDNYRGFETFIIDNEGNVRIDSGSFIVSSSTINLIAGKGNINNYSQINVINQNNGNAASADIVATNDSGTETSGYIDMGINSTGFVGLVGSSSDSYLYNTGSNLLIGNITNGTNSAVKFFSGNNGTSFPLIVTGSQVLVNNVPINSTVMYKLVDNFTSSLSAVLAPVTGWSFPVISGKSYKVEINALYQTAITTTGCKIGVYLTGATGSVVGNMRGAIVSTAAATELSQQISAIGIANLTNSTLLTTGVTAASSSHYLKGDIIFHCAVNGTFNVGYASEVSASLSWLVSGSVLLVQPLQ